MVKVSPSILNVDYAHLADELKRIPNADMLHLDVMDGHFVPNLSYGMCVVESLRKVTKLPLDAHLMISNPEKYIPEFAKAGADIITFHVETGNDPLMLIQQIRNEKKKAGIAVDALTGIEKALPYLDKVDYLLIMSVRAGFGGQSFMPAALEKIKTAKKLVKEKKLKCEIIVDGGINLETGKLCADAGADILVSGSFLMKSNDAKGLIEKMKKL